MALLDRKRILVAALEGSTGVDEGPVGADAIQTRGLEVIPFEAPFLSRNLDRNTLGNQGQIVAKTPLARFNFEVDLAGSGTRGDPPQWGPLIRACGFSEALNSATSATYAPVSGAWPTLTMKAYLDGQRHNGLGALGNAQFRLTAGELPAFIYSFIGSYVEPASASDPTPSFTGWQVPVRVSFANTTVSLHSQAVKMVAFEMNLNNQIENIDIPGHVENLIVDRLPVGTITIHAPAISSKNWFDAVNDRDSGALSIVHGTTVGNIVTISASAVELSNPRYTNSQGVRCIQLDLIPLPTSGNDELSIVAT